MWIEGIDSFSTIALFFSINGIFVLSLGPVVEKFLGSNYLRGTIFFGFASEITAVVTGFMSIDNQIGLFSAVFSTAVLIWCAGVAGRVATQYNKKKNELIKNSEETFDETKTISSKDNVGGGCIHKLVKGRHESSGLIIKGAWYSGLMCRFTASRPTDNGVDLTVYAYGSVFYGIYGRRGRVEEAPSYEIDCIGDDCEIDGTLTGLPGGQDGIVRADVIVVPRIVGKTLVAKIHMGGFLHAEGGPKISAELGKEGIGKIGAEVEWPSATYSTPYKFKPMSWKCEKVSNSGEVGTTQ